ISTFSALTLQNFSMTLLKSSPLFEEKAPQTFSHTAYLGYSPFVLHLISFIIRIASLNKEDLLPSSPARFPAIDRSVHGEPKVIILTGSTSAPLIELMSPKCFI